MSVASMHNAFELLCSNFLDTDSESFLLVSECVFLGCSARFPLQSAANAFEAFLVVFDGSLVLFEVAKALTFLFHVLRESTCGVPINLGHDHSEFARETIGIVADRVLQIWVCTYALHRCNVPECLILTNVFERGNDSDLVGIVKA